ncbi:MAG TPA: hypothetical protein VGS80_07275, partial [Ktedonobacterales bacterium]|nr:hypothetical protein [Ktedonobacterales bacterium]
MRQAPRARQPARWPIASHIRGPLLLIAASTLAIALAAGALTGGVAGALQAGAAVLASVIAGEPNAPTVAQVAVSLARGAAEAGSAALTALMIASVAAVPFVARDLIARRTRRARRERRVDSQEQSTCPEISRRALLTTIAAGCAAGAWVEEGVSTSLQALVDQAIADQNTAITDAAGKRLRLRGVNWFGFETDAFA